MGSPLFHDFVRRTQGLPPQQKATNEFGRVFVKEFLDGFTNIFKTRK
jgi:hypothetical protein